LSDAPTGIAVWVVRALWPVMAIVSIVCFVASFPDYVEYIATGSSGCELKWDGDGARVSKASHSGAPCAAVGLNPGIRVLAIDGQQITSSMPLEQLRALEWGESGSRHVWSVEAAGKSFDVDVPYEHGPLALILSKAGAQNAHLIVAGLTLVGVAMRTGIFLMASLIMVRYGWKKPLPIVLSGAFLAYALGLGLKDGHHAAWLTPLYELSTLFVIIGLALACVLLPDGTYRGLWGRALSAVWITVGALVLAPSYLPWDALAGPANLWTQLGFLAVGVGTLIFRYRYQSSAVEKTQLQWVVLGMVVGFMALLIRMMDVLSPHLAEFHDILVYPLILCATPLAIASAVVQYRVWDLPIVLRRVTVFGMWLLFASTLILAMAELIPWVLRLLDLVPGRDFPTLVVPAVVFLGSMSVSVLLTNVLRKATDSLFFPNRIRSIRALAQAEEALVDCWSLDEVIWCARHVLRASFGAKKCAVLLRVGGEWKPLRTEDHWHRALSPDQWAALDSGEFTMVVGPGNEPPAMMVPLHSHGELVGAVLAHPRSEVGYTSRDIQQMTDLAPFLADAMWRNTREMMLLTEDPVA